MTLVETNGGNAAFSLTNPNNRVDLGAYQYFLTKEGNNWVLAHSQKVLDSTSPAESSNNVATNTESSNSTVPNSSVGTSNSAATTSSSLPSTPLLSDFANVQVSLRQAQLLLVEDDLSGIHQV